MADLDGASATAAEALSAGTGDPLATSAAMATRALVCVHRRHGADALEIIDEAVSLADQIPGRQGHRFPIHITRGSILTELDRLDEASATFGVGRRIGEELGIRWHLPNYQTIGALTHYLAGEWDDAIADVEAARELADETGEGFSLIIGQCVLALIFVHRNDLSRAEEAVRVAMGQLGEPGPRYRTLWAMWTHAFLLEAEGKAGDACALLAECWDQAAAIYERLGAARDLARAEAAFRAAGIHRGRRVTRGRPQAGWQSLTPTERSVADLVAQGLTNPQIGDRLYISRRTVQTHLAHVFAKLDLTSRAQLAALVAEHRGGQP